MFKVKKAKNVLELVRQLQSVGIWTKVLEFFYLKPLNKFLLYISVQTDWLQPTEFLLQRLQYHFQLQNQ